jgi:hypothetical protein
MTAPNKMNQQHLKLLEDLSNASQKLLCAIHDCDRALEQLIDLRQLKVNLDRNRLNDIESKIKITMEDYELKRNTLNSRQADYSLSIRALCEFLSQGATLIRNTNA